MLKDFEPLELDIPPGVYTRKPPRSAKGRWKHMNRMRFYGPTPGDIKGWASQQNAVDGQPRDINAWRTLAGKKYLGVATHKKFYAREATNNYDITPVRDESTGTYSGSGSNLSNPFDTTITSTTVTVNHTAHGIGLDGAVINIANASAVGGITPDGEYFATYVDANTYTIEHSSAATSTVTGGGGTVHWQYMIDAGNQDSAGGFGWGAGTWGLSTWGTARTSSNITVDLKSRILDIWGEDLLVGGTGLPIYIWDSSGGTGTPATEITQSPDDCEFFIVSQLDRHIIALGAHDGTNSDPLLIRWCSQEDYTDWTPSASNTAGDQRIDNGASKIICGHRSGSEILVFTDLSVEVIRYQGPPYTFGLFNVGINCPVIGPRAIASTDVATFYMSNGLFYIYDGVLKELDCDCRNYVFDDFNYKQASKVRAVTNNANSEIWWYYPSANSDFNDRYVFYDYEANAWGYGELNRMVALDTSIFDNDNPVAIDESGTVFTHETGVTADGAALDSFIETWDFELSSGSVMMIIGGLIPEYRAITNTVKVELNLKKYPQDVSYTTKGPFSMTSTRDIVKFKVRGRQASLKFSNDTAGAYQEIGVYRVLVKPHGKK